MKKINIILSAIVLIVVVIVGYSFWSAPKIANLSSTSNQGLVSNLNNPGLLFGYESWSQYCGHGYDDGKDGLCQNVLYLYGDGRLVESGFTTENKVQKNNPVITKNLGVAIVNQVKKIITDSEVMTKTCPNVLPSETGGETYKITINGIAKTFSNPGGACLDAFNQINNLLKK